MSMGHKVSPSDCIFVLCSNDNRAAEYAAELYHQGVAPYIVFSGVGRFTEGSFERSEAETFALLHETLACQTLTLSLRNTQPIPGRMYDSPTNCWTERGLSPKRLTLVQKPFMEKRTLRHVCKAVA